MTIFRNVFQKHLEQQGKAPDPGGVAVDLPDHVAVDMPPPPEAALPTVSLPTAQSHGLPPPMSGAKPAAASPDVPRAEPDDDISARAAEAQRLIAQTQASRSPVPDAAPADAAPGQASRARTRLLGFGGPDAGLVDPLDDLQDTPAEARFPCGWLVIIRGPGRGESFALYPGVAQIGRGADQSICLDFGDRAISREKHAVVAYDREAGQFYIGHGGKSNIIRLNDRPVLSTEEMSHGDVLRVGETALRFCAFCDATFRWEQEEV